MGTEEEGRSQVISCDVADVVDADMVSNVRVFLGGDDVIKFEPTSDDPTDIKEAEQKTAYANWIVKKQPNSYQTIFSWLKDAEIQKMGVIKYYFEDTIKTKTHTYKNISPLRIQELSETLEGEDVKSVEIISQNQNKDGNFELKFKVTRGKQCIKIINIPTESFLITRDSPCLNDAELVGDRVRKTRSQLIAEGFSRDLVDQLQTVEVEQNRQSNQRAIRNQDEGGSDLESSIRDWASQEVDLEDIYVLIDFNQDGIAERRHILKSGNTILENEEFDHVPYAMMSAVPMANKAIGMGRAEVTFETQEVNTQLLRGVLDNVYMVNNGRNVVNDDNVNMDDLLTVRAGGVVRTDGDPQSAVFPLITEYTGDKTLQVIQHMDQRRAARTGGLLASQGLEADQVGEETATRTNVVERESAGKTELVIRNFAELGFKKLYEGVIWLASQYQTTERQIMVLGEQMIINPESWKSNHQAPTQVGLGSGGNEQVSATMASLFQIQQQLKTQGSNLVDGVKEYNVLRRLQWLACFKYSNN
jgi:hypothetical protein